MIHPLIQKLQISDRAKRHFHELELYEIIEDKVFLSNKDHEVDEAMENYWRFQVDFKYCSDKEILAFYQSVIQARSQYLIKNTIKEKMIFYAWYDAQSGNLCFSIIPQNWKKLHLDQTLPFGCTINQVDSLNKIIEKFVQDEYKGTIPLNDLEDIDLSQEDAFQEDDPKNYILDVFSMILPCCTQN